jgi:hypothetical protein
MYKKRVGMFGPKLRAKAAGTSSDYQVRTYSQLRP